MSMIEKTQVMVPTFFLVSPQQSLRITHTMTLGRSNADFTISDSKLSVLHCQFMPRLLSLYIKDLDSTNGVFVNKQKIFPNSEFELHVGDRVVLGSHEFIVCDEEAFKRMQLESSKKLSMLGISLQWWILYALIFFSGVASFIINLGLDHSVPKEIDFLSTFYSQHINVDGIRSLFYILCYCVVHAFAISHFFKQQFARYLSALMLVGGLFLFINFRLGPVWYVKQYLQNREFITGETPNSTGITELKMLVAAEDDLGSAYKKIEKKLADDERKLMAKDFQIIQKKILIRKANLN